MVALIARHTIQRVLDGHFVSHAPDTRFEMPDAEAERLVLAKAAVYAEVVSFEPLVAVPATPAPAEPEQPTEPAPTEPETAPEDASDAEHKPKRTRKAKTEADAE